MKTKLINRQRQQGAMLVITLIMLVLITLISVSTIRTATAEEKMAGNARDRDKAFQAAEGAAQFCLMQIENKTFTGTPLTPTVPPNPQNWEGTWTDANSTTVTVDTAGLATQPRCMFEALGTEGSFRITSRAEGGSDQTVVMLQVTYSVE
jgi:type IV pilus assembly protein PilX